MRKDKYEKIAGGGKRSLQFVQGNGDVPVLKPSRTALTISIGPGLPADSSKIFSGYFLDFDHAVCYLQLLCCVKTNFASWYGQRRIWSPVEGLRWSFVGKILNEF